MQPCSTLWLTMPIIAYCMNSKHWLVSSQEEQNKGITGHLKYSVETTCRLLSIFYKDDSNVVFIGINNFYILVCEFWASCAARNFNWFVKQDLDHKVTKFEQNFLYYHVSPILPIFPLSFISLIITFDTWDCNFTHI